MRKDLLEQNSRLIDRLDADIRNNAVFHAHVIVSQDPKDREDLAKDFIKAILTHSSIRDAGADRVLAAKIDEERHEDVQFLRREKSNIPVKTLRDAIKRIEISPIDERNIILIIDGDKVKEDGQNTLLKTLEEPPGDSVIIILVENLENLLPTVKSRCIIHQVEEAQTEEPEEIRKMTDEVLGLADEGAGYYRLYEATKSINDKRDKIAALIDLMEGSMRDRLLVRDEKNVPYGLEKVSDNIHALEDARRKMDRGYSARYILKDLLLKIGG